MSTYQYIMLQRKKQQATNSEPAIVAGVQNGIGNGHVLETGKAESTIVRLCLKHTTTEYVFILGTYAMKVHVGNIL